jgi:hypothetical protein
VLLMLLATCLEIVDTSGVIWIIYGFPVHFTKVFLEYEYALGGLDEYGELHLSKGRCQ